MLTWSARCSRGLGPRGGGGGVELRIGMAALQAKSMTSHRLPQPTSSTARLGGRLASRFIAKLRYSLNGLTPLSNNEAPRDIIR